jgi:outer membrane usher protein
MPSYLRRSAANTVVALFVSIGIGLMASGRSLADTSLQLEVIINGFPTHTIASFVQSDDGRISATATELAELGIRTGRSPDSTVLVGLDEIPTLTYKYDERSQQLLITVSDAQRIPRAYDASGRPRLAPTPSEWGGALNYDLLLASEDLAALPTWLVDATSLTLDGRVFSPYGTFSQSGYLSADGLWPSQIFRLDTTYRYSDHERLISYRVGDAITGGLPWTRPVRIGGVQAQRDFSMRPDLVTIPLPTLSGSAAVPSTVEIFIDNMRTYSQEVGAGPFTISNVPIITDAGEARIVVRDAMGRETTRSVPLYASAVLLAPGLTAFSAEAGFPRVSYGGAGDTYLGSPVVAGTLRRGIYDWLTVEGHGEVGGGVLNAGAGAALATRRNGTLTGAVAASVRGDRLGAQLHLSYATRLSNLRINFSSSRTLGDYHDLASTVVQTSGAPVGPGRALDRITVGVPLPFDRNMGLSASFIHAEDSAGVQSNIVSASASRTLPGDASLYGTAFADFGDQERYGVFVGYARRLGPALSASASVSTSGSGTTVGVEASRPLGPSVGSYGWRVRDAEGANQFREASLSYRSAYALLRGTVNHSPGGARATVETSGSVATLGGRVFFANRIDDAFAIVRAGFPNVPVFYDNRPVGVTDARGEILIPSLRSYDANKISIDPGNLPVDAEIATVRQVVAPSDRAGVIVDFGVRTSTSSALVVFSYEDGSFVPVGSTGKSETGEEFVVGYDGQAFLEDLAAQNAVTIETAQGPCRARFAFTPRPNEQTVISSVVCVRTAGSSGQQEATRLPTSQMALRLSTSP